MQRDPAYLLDMLIEARHAVDFLKDISREAFEGDLMRQRAVMSCVVVIGEAANRVSREFQRQHSEIAWRDIIGMRNRLIHDYMNIDIEKVWDTVHHDIPVLIKQLEPLIPPE